MTAHAVHYDAFISYRHQEPDQSWVRKTLQPRLEAEGLRICIDYRDFRLGAPIITEMTRGIEQSRYMVAVFSNAYLKSNFTNLERLMAQHLGLEESQRRLIVVMREQCTPSLDVRVHLWLDMTDNSLFDTMVAHLVDTLRHPSNF